MDKSFSTRHRHHCAWLDFIHHLLSIRCCDYANRVQRCHPVLSLLKSVGTAGVCGARKAFEHYLLTPISALPTSRLLPSRAQVTKLQLSGQPSPALPTDWQTPHPVCGLMLLHHHHHRSWEEIPKQQCLRSSSAPRLEGSPTSSPPWRRLDQRWLFSPARFPGQSSATPLSTHLSYYITLSKCSKAFQHHWNIVSEDEI